MTDRRSKRRKASGLIYILSGVNAGGAREPPFEVRAAAGHTVSATGGHVQSFLAARPAVIRLDDNARNRGHIGDPFLVALTAVPTAALP